MRAESAQFAEENMSPLEYRAACLGQSNAVTRSIEKSQPEIGLQILDGRKDGRMRATECLGGRLKAALGATALNREAAESSED
jgi:hypothetical protein